MSAVLVASAWWIHSVDAQPASRIEGTWFGTIVVANPDGTASHDTAVLIIKGAGQSVSGSMGRTIDQQTLWNEGSFKDRQLRFHLDAAGGLNVDLKLTGESLVGSAMGERMKARIELKPAPGLLPHGELQQEILAADQQVFQAFGNCDSAGYARLLSKDLEFYQDRTGKTGYEENLKALRDRCAEGIRLRRELDQNSLIVNAVPGFEAIEAGTQRFYSQDQKGQEHLDATTRFTNVWRRESGVWKLVRVISYDHR